MSRNVIAGGAAQRAIAGLMSLALVSGGLVVPSVANAAEETGKAVCNSEGVAPRPRGDAPKGMSLNRDVYKIGGVVEIKITGLTDITAKHKLRLTLSGAQWPTDQSAGDGLERVRESPVLDIPTSKIKNGEVTVKAVLPSEFEGVFRPGKNILIAQLEDGTKVTGVRGVEVWVNESGKAAGACGPENPNGDKPEPEDAPASNSQSGRDQDTNPDDSNQGNAEQPGNENQDGKSADQDNKDQGTKPSDQGNKDQDSKDQGDDNPSDQSGKDQDDKAQSSKDQSDKGQDGTSAGQDNKDQDGKPGNNEQAGVEKPAGQDGKPADQDNKDQGTKPADQGGKDQGTKPSGQNKPADQADKDQGGKDQSGKPDDQAGKDQAGKDQDGKNQGPQDPKDPKITPSTQFSQLSSVRGIVGSIFAVLGLTALFAGALGVMAKYNVIPANWIPQQLRHLSR